MSKTTGDAVKGKLVALRMTPAEVAAVDEATRGLAGGALEPTRSQMMRLLLRLGLERVGRASADELARLVVMGAGLPAPPPPPAAAPAPANSGRWIQPTQRPAQSEPPR